MNDKSPLSGAEQRFAWNRRCLASAALLATACFPLGTWAAYSCPAGKETYFRNSISSGEGGRLTGSSPMLVCQQLVATWPRVANGGVMRVSYTLHGPIEQPEPGYYKCRVSRLTVYAETGETYWPDTDTGDYDGVTIVCATRVVTFRQKYPSSGTCAAVGNPTAVGNPIYPGTGTKRQSEVLGAWLGRSVWLTYDTYRQLPEPESLPVPNLAAFVPSFGDAWSGSLHKRLLPEKNARGNIGRIQAWRGGQWITFIRSDAGVITVDGDISDRLQETGSGWRYTDAASGAIEDYDASGVLLSVSRIDGARFAYTYSDATTPVSVAPMPGLLISIQDHNGRVLSFNYEQPGGIVPRIVEIGGTVGIAARFGYDAAGNLSAIRWLDETTRQYLYDPTVTWALTGIVSETGRRLSTYTYDAGGRALSTEYAGGVGRYSVEYRGVLPERKVRRELDLDENTMWITYEWASSGSPVVTMPNGQSSEWKLTGANGVALVAERSQPAGSGCAASTSHAQYDANGNVTRSDDFNGTRACRTFDTARNLTTASVEGLTNTVDCATVTGSGATLPAGSRKTSQQWHPDWRLETKRAEPGRLTTYVYNGQPDPFASNAIASCAPASAVLPNGKPIAVLCKQVEQATTDVDGSKGFSAVLQAGVVNRVWTYTYNARGQVLTAKSPRTDVNETTTYAYYEDTTAEHTLGDLKSVTNAKNQVTQYPLYTKAGQVQRMIDVNNVVTDYTYDARQRLKTITTANRLVSSLDYHPTGQLKRATQADGSFVDYGYDDAQRLVSVSDHLGNRIEYTLDLAGNKKAEQVKDPAGALNRQMNQVMDALNRVQQSTGRN